MSNQSFSSFYILKESNFELRILLNVNWSNLLKRTIYCRCKYKTHKKLSTILDYIFYLTAFYSESRKVFRGRKKSRFHCIDLLLKLWRMLFHFIFSSKQRITPSDAFQENYNVLKLTGIWNRASSWNVHAQWWKVVFLRCQIYFTELSNLSGQNVKHHQQQRLK